MDIKDWILIGGGLLLAAVIIHGFWVAWTSRRDTLKMAIDQNIPREEVDDLLLLKAELPNGGARPQGEGLDPGGEQAEAKPTQTSMFSEPEPQRSDAITAEPVARSKAAKSSAHKPSREALRDAPLDEPEEILVISVLGRNGETFPGNDLMQVFLRNGLKFGDMNIFHRLDVTTKATQFSVISLVEPGSFDLSQMDDFSTPGISFFLKMPGPEEPLVVFEDMLHVARDVAAALGGDLKDEQMCVITSQTIEHMKQRIAEFSRKRMSQRARETSN